MNKYIRIASVAAAVAALACACSRENAPEAQPEFVDVPFAISVAEVEGATRAAAALFPEVENWLFDIYYCQYSVDGPSLMSGHIRADVAVTDGALSVTQQIRLRTASNTTVVFAANIVPAGGNYGDNPNWEADGDIQFGHVNNLGDLKAVKFDMTKRLDKAQDGTLKHVPMCGYWVGNISGAAGSSSNKPATVTLGRMISKLCVNITNNSGSPIKSVKINNVSTKAYLFPQTENTPLEAGDYKTYTDNVNIANGASATLYFYTAPNFCVKNGNVTSFTFTNNAGKSATQIVGSDLEVEDYNLYMNTIYTFHFTLK